MAKKSKPTKSKANNSETREKLKHTPFESANKLKKASNDIRQKTWEQLEKARIFSELLEKPDFEFVKKEFQAGLKCKYSNTKEYLVKVYSEGIGVDVDVNEELFKDIPNSIAIVETLLRSLGDTFSKSYYQAKGILPSDPNVEELLNLLKQQVGK